MSYSELVSIMTAKEKKGFNFFLESRNKRNTNRSVSLFKSWVQGNPDKLKTTLSANAFNVLRKRTSDLLIEFMAQSSMNTPEFTESKVYEHLFIAKRLLSHNPSKLGFSLLKKAEKEALNRHRYSLLNDVYQTAIEYSFHPLSEDQEKLFVKAEQNKQRIAHEEVLNRLHAKIKKAFYNAEYKKETIDFESIIHNPIEELQSSFPDVAIPYETLFKIVQVFDLYAAQLRNYSSIDSFIVEQWERTNEIYADKKYDRYYKLETLYALANIHFRKKEFAKSLSYLDLLEKEISTAKDQYSSKYKVPLITLKALNLHFTNQPSIAEKLLSNLIDVEGYVKKELYSAILTKAMIAFHCADYKSTAQLLAQLNFSDAWYEKTVGIDWNLHKKYMEILLHIELGNIDYTESRINSLKRKYKRQLEGERNSQVLPFLTLIESYINDPSAIHTDTFKERLENSIQWKQKDEEDIFFMCFYAWLKCKMDKTSLYATTLALVTKRNS